MIDDIKICDIEDYRVFDHKIDDDDDTLIAIRKQSISTLDSTKIYNQINQLNLDLSLDKMKIKTSPSATTLTIFVMINILLIIYLNNLKPFPSDILAKIMLVNILLIPSYAAIAYTKGEKKKLQQTYTKIRFDLNRLNHLRKESHERNDNCNWKESLTTGDVVELDIGSKHCFGQIIKDDGGENITLLTFDDYPKWGRKQDIVGEKLGNELFGFEEILYYVNQKAYKSSVVDIEEETGTIWLYDDKLDDFYDDYFEEDNVVFSSSNLGRKRCLRCGKKLGIPGGVATRGVLATAMAPFSFGASFFWLFMPFKDGSGHCSICSDKK